MGAGGGDADCWDCRAPLGDRKTHLPPGGPGGTPDEPLPFELDDAVNILGRRVPKKRLCWSNSDVLVASNEREQPGGPGPLGARLASLSHTMAHEIGTCSSLFINLLYWRPKMMKMGCLSDPGGFSDTRGGDGGLKTPKSLQLRLVTLNHRQGHTRVRRPIQIRCYIWHIQAVGRLCASVKTSDINKTAVVPMRGRQNHTL